MHRLLLCLLLFAAMLPAADSTVVVRATEPTRAPAWAVLERRLIQTMNEAAPHYLKRFTRPGGAVHGRGDVDDIYEMFFNWPLFYALGGDEFVLHTALDEFNAISRQFSGRQVVNEFMADIDWFHLGEGAMSFYDFGVGNPAVPENVARARRFAGFYLNEDPAARNWDPEVKRVISPFTGSTGARVKDSSGGIRYRLDPQYGWTTLYPVVKDLEPGWYKTPARAKEIEEIYNRIVVREDVPVNLAITGLLTNAYLYTGDEKYRRWVLDYAEAWMARIRQNNGIIPDNIGPSGKPGELRDGQWWGGHYGWTSRYSIHMIYGALTIAAECAHLLSGDARYLELLRSQIDMLLSHGRMENGQLLVPFKHGPRGWEDYRPMTIRDLAHLYHASLDAADWRRIETVRAASRQLPLPYSNGLLRNPPPQIWKPAGRTFDWNVVPVLGDRDDDSAAEFPRLQYYAGLNPDWPEKALAADFQESARRLAAMRALKSDAGPLLGDDLYPFNPVITKGLVMVTTGAPETIYNGGLLRSTVRYYDRDHHRPGLPPDVAALVERLEAGRVAIRLVNLNVLEGRSLVVQAGAFGEHGFTEVNGSPAQGTHFIVEMPPATEIRVEAGLRRFVNRPSYTPVWAGR